MTTFRRICLAYGAGALGGLMACMVVTLLHKAEVMDALGVTYRPGIFRTFHVKGPDLALGRTGIYIVWIYEAVCLYGLCGFLTLQTWLKWTQVQRALIYSTIPIICDLLIFFPKNGYDWFGMYFGGFTFLFIIIPSFTWGFVTVCFEPGK